MFKYLFYGISIIILFVSSSLSFAAEWYKATAKPNLVVRSSPSVTGIKIGKVSFGGKMKVLEVVSSRQSIGGRHGKWVRIQWRSGSGYVFSAFLRPLENRSHNNKGWYIANATPSLIVRSRPSVSARKKGNIPQGGKVKVLKFIGSKEFIGGRSGYWTKIEWKSGAGYVFSAFLLPL